MSFSELGLSEPILKALSKQGYDKPSAIQIEAIPTILAGSDVMAAAQTGTGKTAGFALPIIERLNQSLNQGKKIKPKHVGALILTPTRELAAQVNTSIEKYAAHLRVRSTVVFGGVKIGPQIARLRKGVDVLVATPGRLLDLHAQHALSFNQLEVLVLDEADRMLDMGFINDIHKIISLLPHNRQNLMFSATFSSEIRKLASKLVKDPVEISVTPRNTAAKSVEQWVYPVDKRKKPALLTKLIIDEQWYQALVFTRTKHGADRLVKQLAANNVNAAAIHGNKSQAMRTKALTAFKKGKVQVLVATDIAARGIDISKLPQVVNFDLPHVAEDYVHRIGRTGRAGEEGRAISLVSADEIKQLNAIERFIGKKIERKLIDDFEPEHDVPESKGPHAPRQKPKRKPRPNKSGPHRKKVEGADKKPEKRTRKKPSNAAKPRPGGHHKPTGDKPRAPRKRASQNRSRGQAKTD